MKSNYKTPMVIAEIVKTQENKGVINKKDIGV